MDTKKVIAVIIGLLIFATVLEAVQIKRQVKGQEIREKETIENRKKSAENPTIKTFIEEVTTEKQTTVKTALETVKTQKAEDETKHETDETKHETDGIVAMYGFSAAEFELFQRVVFAEAGNQGFKGKQLVADVILNRLASKQFPDTLGEVLLQENQFSCVSTGAIYCYDLDEESKQAIIAELMLERQNKDIIFFRTESFSEYGTPAFQYGDHYFSTK